MSHSFDDISAQLKGRHRRTQRLKYMSMAALALAATFLVVFIGDMLMRGYPAFQQAELKVPVTYSEQSREIPLAAVEEDVRELVSRGWLRQLPREMKANPELLGQTLETWVIADDRVDQYLKGHKAHLKPKQIAVLDRMVENGTAELKFNINFFTTGDSKMPEYAGIWSAAMGTILTLLVTLAFAFPVGVLTAVYLEEFAPDNRLTQAIEININNLAAVPSILFGLLGLAIFINFFGMPRSSPLVGGLTLGLMTLPVIIITTRSALRSVPDTIRQAAFGVGCSRWQVVRDHVLPLSLPGILTGSIIGLAQAMGETAPLIIVGMVAFIPDAPTSITQAATVLPAQIFTWAGEPEQAYVERTAAGILVLLSVLIFLNAAAVMLRKKFERRW
ncbi:phosphate ABC transporter permease PstA [Cobetia marina]|jgi:phosphate transport system permease protein|uniref:Phosphate transport system permease protein PstA n=1 Tax=Cobetia marina TaxID=28258 RepID=A0ABU9GBE3_COBMA|nr:MULTISPECIES: phosphate ABC transporter permease PstA [Cobetia]AOM02243.1 phosphate ABC transporter, permease protein PstA [Cobetia marina]AZV32083.1 phosphate ABC transporter, permease protein PstA [Cobetia sp. ICG0124]MDA5563168.1 phosphate ABC transporter permease PstA [Cobetia sp. MMG027]MDH2292606.1 phosphate ABC transporter permease PstA [Cobetia sp. 10Alg 146]MDI6003390.1 phosphate ABC transporter permease PstA [Cobetia pacifica]